MRDLLCEDLHWNCAIVSVCRANLFGMEFSFCICGVFFVKLNCSLPAFLRFRRNKCRKNGGPARKKMHHIEKPPLESKAHRTVRRNMNCLYSGCYIMIILMAICEKRFWKICAKCFAIWKQDSWVKLNMCAQAYIALYWLGGEASSDWLAW